MTKDLSMVSRLKLIAPFLCALYPFLSLYLQNIYYFNLIEVLEVALSITVAMYLLWRGLLWLIKDRSYALFYLWFVVVGLGLYQYISQGIYVVTGNRGAFSAANSIVFVIWVCILWLILKGLLRIIGKRLNSILEIGAVFSVMLCAVALFNHAMKLRDTERFSSISRAVIESNSSDRWPIHHAVTQSSPTAEDNTDKSAYPDIYFILTDGLARRDALTEFFDYDSAPFEVGLRSEGVFVVEKARANYSQTLLAFPSMLNLNYISDEVRKLGVDRSYLIAAFNDNKLTNGLRQLGYQVLAFESAYPGTQGLKADTIYPVSGYANQFLQNSLVVLSFPPVGNILSSWQLDLHRKRSKNILDNIGRVQCNKDVPKLVMGHLMMPHPPFVVDEEGREINLGEPSNIDGAGVYSPKIYKKHYSAQAKYVHKRLLEAVRAIKSNSCRPAYIIITADHGSLLNEVKKGLPTPLLMRERSSIFSAVYFPDGDYSSLSADMTPIGLVRRTLNHTGLAELPPIAERTFYSHWDRPYEFSEVGGGVLQ